MINKNYDKKNGVSDELLSCIVGNADVNHDGKAGFGELYRHFRQNSLSGFDSFYNTLFIYSLNKIAQSSRRKDGIAGAGLFTHPRGWFKDKERLAKKGIWAVFVNLLLLLASVIAYISRVPKAIGGSLTAAGEGMENSERAGIFIKRILPYLLCAVLAFGAYDFMKVSANKTPALDIFIDGERVGTVKSTEVFYSAIDIAEKNLSNMLGISYKIPDSTAQLRVEAYKSPEYLSDSELASYLVKSSEKYLALGYGLYIDELLVAVGPSRMIMDGVLSETLALYNSLYSATKNEAELISFANSVIIKEITVPKTVIKSEDEIRRILGLDGLSSVSDFLLRDNSTEKLTALQVSNMLPTLQTITSEDISKELPEDAVYYVDSETHDSSLANDSGTVGAVEDSETGKTTVLSFKTTKVQTVTEIMPCDIKYTYDKNILEGRKIVAVPGVDGIKKATYEISYIGDTEIGRVLVEQTVIKQPVTKEIKVGTKPASEFNAETGVTGTFIRPCVGTTTSTFSGRTLFGAYEFHGALDIAGRHGSDIIASDGGEIVYAGWNGTYGNCIIIDHGDGLETLYAHLSAYAVEKGDLVGQGWKIGEMGATGRVTGVHLHFEVRVNGVRQDPMDYLVN